MGGGKRRCGVLRCFVVDFVGSDLVVWSGAVGGVDLFFGLIN